MAGRLLQLCCASRKIGGELGDHRVDETMISAHTKLTIFDVGVFSSFSGRSLKHDVRARRPRGLGEFKGAVSQTSTAPGGNDLGEGVCSSGFRDGLRLGVRDEIQSDGFSVERLGKLPVGRIKNIGVLQQQGFDAGNHARREGRVDLDGVQIKWLGVHRSPPFVRFAPRTESLLSKVAL